MYTKDARRAGTVLLVNPNTNIATTEMMRSLAERELAGTGLAVEGLTAAAGPAMILDPVALAASAPEVLEAVHRRLADDGGTVRAVIVAAIGDPGRKELEALLPGIPVIGIGQASVLKASAGGRGFGMATSTPLLAESLGVLAAEHGGGAAFAGVELTVSPPLELAADPERQFQELSDAVGRCVQAGAEAVIIAGGPLSETARRLAEQGTVEIVEPVPSACALVRERLGIA
ncbi:MULTISPECIES: aspartate/glutamate racemase family protein [Arthrobacter]|uniref:Aspartate/glutamate racemase family protein n=2 Tax=Arthrobacter TaxID=1663 RepID=A0ABU9KQR2_9MICC|nr:aspartate/glutamate racemase family protein [Arthrobacter sp. YJM1]MDP5228495.1 aspartate/glutamate racemase family protein [Arthrobacter sp. YJM1]